MRTSKQIVEANIKEEIFSLLPTLFSDMSTVQQTSEFLNSFLSEKEYEVLSKRMAILYWLHKGKHYNEIKNLLKVSSATIATSQNLIEEKQNLAQAFRILDANDWAGRVSQKIKKFVGK